LESLGKQQQHYRFEDLKSREKRFSHVVMNGLNDELEQPHQKSDTKRHVSNATRNISAVNESIA